jgi:hypothetical protein
VEFSQYDDNDINDVAVQVGPTGPDRHLYRLL